MKKYFLLLSTVTFLTSLETSAQCPITIHFSTQAQIDEFPTSFPACTQLPYWVVIQGADITNLDGLSQITSIAADLEISYNDALTSLTGLDNLTTVAGEVSIDFNTALTSLTGLDNIDPTKITYLYLQNSGLLSASDVQSICDYLAIPLNLAVIWGNATGCASREEVESACLVPVGVIESEEAAIYPNPTKGILEITGHDMEHGTFVVLDAIGRIVKKGDVHARQIDMSELLKGMYFICLHWNNQTLVKRILKE
ncbi:MAG: T9SS type A sorting domain-containing protein [Saprospirales bacterium]|nr:T9SS type A sorting domain-containing protein [Saprospirales bacterium]